LRVRIVSSVFDPLTETAAFVDGRSDAGALVSFVGYCRNQSGAEAVQELTIDHYGAFTEREITRIASEVAGGCDILDALVVHRVGRILPGEAIVLVATLSRHRAAAFEAASALMDRLKTDAPLWKKESGPDGARWIEPTAEDHRRRKAIGTP
jgi:molybdopterin synthase catalytic subunit